MTSTALISEKERLYHFYITCNMSKEETCKAMGYYCVRGKNKGKPSRWFLEESIRKYNIKKPKFLNTFNLQKSIYLVYGVNSMTKLPEIQAKKRATCLKKYGFESIFQSKERMEKIHEMQKINGSLRTSKPENDIYELLLLKFPKTIHHLKDKEKYPFYCDFYIPEIDTWIEYQGTVEHGNYKGETLGPYKADNLKHQTVVKELQEKSINHPRYETILKVWTISDPLKRKTAHENGLNWLEFFNMKEFINWYNSI